jgi:hypothetical protein
MTAFGSFRVKRVKKEIEGFDTRVQTTPHSIHNIRYFAAFPAVGGILFRPKGATSINN